MNENAANANRICGLKNAACRIVEKSPPNASSLPCLIYCKASENDDRNRIGHISSETSGDSLDGYSPRSQRIIPDNRIFFAQDIGTRTAAGLVRARTAFKPSVK